MTAAEQYYILCDDRVLVRKDRAEISAFSGSEWPVLKPWARTILPLDKSREARNFVVDLAVDFDTGSDFAWVSLRSLVGRIDDSRFNLWGKAAQLLHWQKNHRYCGHCGQETVPHETEQARVCPACALSWYPRISPCVIVLISRGEEMLLARSAAIPRGDVQHPGRICRTG